MWTDQELQEWAEAHTQVGYPPAVAVLRLLTEKQEYATFCEEQRRWRMQMSEVNTRLALERDTLKDGVKALEENLGAAMSEHAETIHRYDELLFQLSAEV